MFVTTYFIMIFIIIFIIIFIMIFIIKTIPAYCYMRGSFGAEVPTGDHTPITPYLSLFHSHKVRSVPPVKESTELASVALVSLSYNYKPRSSITPGVMNECDSVSLRISHIYLTPSYSNKVCPAHANMECVEPISLSHPPLTPTPPLYNDRQL